MLVSARLRTVVVVTVALRTFAFATNADAAPPAVASERRLIPPDPENSSEAGWSVAVDGDTVVVGADQDNRAGAGAGAVFVYTGAAAAPTLQATLTASDAEAADNLGISVAIDGDVIVAGAFHRFGATPEPGRAYIFRRTGTTWTQEAKLVAPDGVNNDAFGWSVAVKGDIAVVGAPLAWSGSPFGNSKVYVFERVDGEWTYEGKLTRPNEYVFGWSLGFDGTTLAVGASFGLSSSPGRVFVYRRDPFGTFNYWQTLQPSDLGANAEFGNSVAVSGTHMVVGAWFNDAGGTLGSAYFFDKDVNDIWSQSGKFDSPGGAAAETFGEAVAIDGERAVVTDSGLDVDGVEDLGAAYLYKHGPGGWSSAGTLRASDGETGDYYGTAVALQGSRILVGAAYAFDEVSQSYPGSAYLLQLSAKSKLLIKNALPDNESRNVITVKAKGLSVDLPFPGSPDDPTCAGGGTASLDITSPTSGASFSQLLPCANWQQTSVGYRYRDPELDDGPCKEVYFQPNGTTTIKCTGRGPTALGFDLEPGVQQVPIVVRLTVGTQSYCTSFGGTLKSDGTNGILFSAVNGPATEVCTAP